MAFNNGVNAASTGIQTLSSAGAWSGSTVTQYGVLVGGSTNAVGSTAVGSAGQVLQSSGAGVNPAYSTATYPATTTVSQLLYSSATNTVSGLATANNGVLITSATGVPSLLAAGTTGQILTATTGSPATWAAPAIVNTSRPAFNAIPSGTLSNVTGDGTLYAIVWGTIVSQYGSNFNTGTGIFTAPVTGFYQFNTSFQLIGLLVGHTSMAANFFTTSRNYYFNGLNPFVCAETVSDSYLVSGSVTAFMTAGDQAAVSLVVSGSTKVVDVTVNGHFSGFLVA